MRKLCRILDAPALATAFKVAYMLVMFLAFSALAADEAWLSYLSYAVVALGALVLVGRLANARSYLKMPFLVLLALFIVSAVISAVVTLRYGFTENLKALVWTTLQFFVLYALDMKRDAIAYRREFKVIAGVFLGCTAILALASIALATIGYETTDIEFWWYGKNAVGLYSGRLYGLYCDPNYGAVCSVIATVLLFYFLQMRTARRATEGRSDRSMGIASKTRASRLRGLLIPALLLVDILMQLTYLSLSASRTGLVCAVVAIASFALLTFLCGAWARRLRILPRALMSLVLFAAVAGGVFAVDTGISALYNAASPSLHAFFGYENASRDYDPEGWIGQIEAYDKNGTLIGESTKDEPVLDANTDESAILHSENAAGVTERTDTTGDISNNRFAIWRAALDVFKANPLVGTSSRNLLPLVTDTQPDSYIAQTKYNSMHNTFIDVLVSQGIVGFVIFMVLVVRVFVFVCARIGRLPDGESSRYATALFSCVLASAPAMLFLTEVVYINTVESLMFWMTLGYLVHMLSTKTCNTKDEAGEPVE